jgi:Zn-dependent protease
LRIAGRRRTFRARDGLDRFLAIEDDTLGFVPLPPLDGGRIAVSALPGPLGYSLSRLEPLGFPILIGLLFILPLMGAQLGLNLNVISQLIGSSADAVIEPVLRITGNVA